MMTLVNTIQHTFDPLCSHLLKLGFDLFRKKTAAIEALGFDDIDESKIENIAKCENKRLMRFANEFPHEQHLLNLQSTLVALLSKLARHLTNEATSIDEFRRELFRIAVLLNEIDIELAKAKRRKEFALFAEHRAALIQEELIKLAAENHRSSSSKKENRPVLQRTNEAQKEADNAKKREQTERAAYIRESTEHARKLLMQYRLHVITRRALRRHAENRMRERLKQIMQQMSVAQELQAEIIEKTMFSLRLSKI